MEQLYEGCGFFLNCFDIMWVKMDGFIALLDAIGEILHVKITQRPVQIKRRIFGMDLYCFAIKMKGLFVVPRFISLIALFFELRGLFSTHFGWDIL